MPGVIGLSIWARIDDQRQRSFVTGYRGRSSAFGITKRYEGVCMQDAVSQWAMAARRRLRGGCHGA